jgi:hypothetical protein
MWRSACRFSSRTQRKLQERAHAIIERRPELEYYFDDFALIGEASASGV